jgi:hypothetical protein
MRAAKRPTLRSPPHAGRSAPPAASASAFSRSLPPSDGERRHKALSDRAWRRLNRRAGGAGRQRRGQPAAATHAQWQRAGAGHAGCRYNFDNLGRVENARAYLVLSEGTRSADQQRNAGGSDRRTTDDGGHIVGNRFNPPTEEFNLFAQDANFNRGAYRTLEGQWANALAEGKSVKVEWKFYYSASSVRPDRLEVRYWVDGAESTRRFNNASGGK